MIFIGRKLNKFPFLPVLPDVHITVNSWCIANSTLKQLNLTMNLNLYTLRGYKSNKFTTAACIHVFITPSSQLHHRQVRRVAASHVHWGQGKRPGLLQPGRRGVPRGQASHDQSGARHATMTTTIRTSRSTLRTRQPR